VAEQPGSQLERVSAELYEPRYACGLAGQQSFMVTRTPLREDTRKHVEPSHGLLHRAEEWVEETHGLAPESEPEEGVPWHAVVLVVAGLALLIAVEITLAFGIAKVVTGRAY